MKKKSKRKTGRKPEPRKEKHKKKEVKKPVSFHEGIKNIFHLKERRRKTGEKRKEDTFIKTGIPGFDRLFEKGIPAGSSILLAGGAGSGKTIMGLQILANSAHKGKKCLYMSFEESEERLREHMSNFGWNPEELEKKGNLMIKRFSTFDVSRALDALLAKSRGELLIDVEPIILPDNFVPEIIVVDSLTAIASAFAGREAYRSYIEHLFRYFENLRVNSFLITETQQVPTIYSPTGVEEFLADGVIVLYNVRKGDIRESAIEILKMRGSKHIKKVVAMQVVSGTGIEVYPEQEVFGEIK